jgi:hypothetical protein
MTEDRLRRVRIDRIVVRGRPLAPGEELVLRATLRRGLGTDTAPSAGGGDAAQLGAAVADAVRARATAGDGQDAATRRPRGSAGR